MNPLMLYPALALAALLTMGGFYKYGYSSGWDDRDTEMQIEIARKNEEARAKEQEMAKAVATKDAELRKAKDVIDKKQTDLNAAIRAGRVRFPSASCPQASPSSSTPTGNSDTTQSELERQTIEALIDIAAEGDKAINKLNSCVSAYNEMRELVNGQR